MSGHQHPLAQRPGIEGGVGHAQGTSQAVGQGLAEMDGNLAAADAEIRAAARRAGAEEFILALPTGYETHIGEKGVKLSGGQKQRISIARSILTAPRVLILDEATAFLDPSVEERLKQALRELMTERTVVVVSHRASALEGADKLVSIDKGQVVYCGPFDGAVGNGVDGGPEAGEHGLS